MPTNSWTGAEDTDISNDDNWSLGFHPEYPTHIDDIVFNNAVDCDFANYPDGGLICNDLDCTGYTGEWLRTGGGDMGVSLAGGDVVLSAGMTMPAIVSFGSLPGCTAIHINANGQTCVQVQAPENGTLSFSGDTTLKGMSSSNGSTLALGSYVYTILLTGTEERGISLNGTDTDCTYEPGCKIVFQGPAGTYGDINSNPGGASFPPIECNTGIQLYNGGDNINCESLLMGASSGGAWLGSGVHVVTIGDCTWLGGPLTNDGTTEKIPGVTFDVGGNFSAAINLNSDAGMGEIAVFNVTGLADATGGASQTIKNCDFSGGSTLYAPGCVDGGGNTNVVFAARGGSGPAPRERNGWAKGLLGHFNRRPMNTKK